MFIANNPRMHKVGVLHLVPIDHRVRSRKRVPPMWSHWRYSSRDRPGRSRSTGIGNIAISSSGQDEMEIVAVGVPDPERIAKVVRKYQ